MASNPRDYLDSAPVKESLEQPTSAAIVEVNHERQPDRPVPLVETPVIRDLDSAFVEQLASRVQVEVTPLQATTIDTPDKAASLPWEPGDAPTRAFIETSSHEAKVAFFLLDAAILAQSDRGAGDAHIDRAQRTLARALEDREVLSVMGKQGLTRDDVTEFARDDPAKLVQVLGTAVRSLQLDRDLTRTLAPDVNSISASPELARADALVRDAEATGAEPAAKAIGAEQTAKTGRDGPSFEIGDVPADVDRRYHTENSRWRDQRGFYEGAAAKDPAFHDRGNKLVSGIQSPAVIADMVAIAEHRGWKSIEVTGTEEFRREAWLKAREQGLEVRGYKPNERDLQELGKRREQIDDRRNDAITAVREPTAAAERTPSSAKEPVERGEAITTKAAPLPAAAPSADREQVDTASAKVAPTAERGTAIVTDRASAQRVEDRTDSVPAKAVAAGRNTPPTLEGERTLLSVSFYEVEAAKAAGARWDKDAKSWYVEGKDKLHAAVPWIPDSEQKRTEAMIAGNRNARGQMRVVEAMVEKSLPDDPEGRRLVLAASRAVLADAVERGQRIPPPEFKVVDKARDPAPAEAATPARPIAARPARERSMER